jgi:type IV pilus biogenesis protein CpaD/CtpE
LADENYISEGNELTVKENKISHFFNVDLNFYLLTGELGRIHNLLQTARREGVENVGFMLVSGKSIPIEQQERVKRQVYGIMHRCGFADTRITDAGMCIYRNAKMSVRIDMLKYDLKMPNCDPWSEYIGDINTNKHIPRFGASASYNLGEMIFNKADLVAPREYQGMRAETPSQTTASAPATAPAPALTPAKDSSAPNGVAGAKQ